MILLSGCSNTSEEVETIEEYSVVIIEDSVIEAEEVIKEPIIEAIEPIEAIETPVVEEPICKQQGDSCKECYRLLYRECSAGYIRYGPFNGWTDAVL